MLAIAHGEARAEVSWEALDGDRYWWELTKSQETVHVEVVRLRIRGNGGQQGGRLLAGDCSVDVLCSVIAEGTMQLHLRHGQRGYREATSTPFPVDALDDLEAVTADR